MTAETLGHRLRRDRKAKGLTLEQLGAQVGCGRPHLSRIENGHDEPSDWLLEELADVLGQDFEEYTLAARRLPGWAAEMLAEQPDEWLALLRRRHRVMHAPIEELLGLSSLGAPEVVALAAQTSDETVAHVLEMARRCCARCGCLEKWHLHGFESWGECDGFVDGVECDCPMYEEPEDRDGL